MQRFREPETQWDQHRPPGSPAPGSPGGPKLRLRPNHRLPLNQMMGSGVSCSGSFGKT